MGNPMDRVSTYKYWGMTRRMRSQGEYLDSSAYVYYDMYNGKNCKWFEW